MTKTFFFLYKPFKAFFRLDTQLPVSCERNMPTIEFTVVNLPLYSQKMQIGTQTNIMEGDTFFDVVGKLDNQLWKTVYNTLDAKQKDRILLFKGCKSLLHSIWNPKTNQVYSDVVFIARPDFSSREKLPIFSDFDYILPHNADITIGPDQGC